MIYFYLFITFFQIGLFGFGGGYGMLSLIQGEVVHHWHWMNTAEFTDIVAISQSTPGPIGINAATYVGYTSVINAGYPAWAAVLGAVLASLSIMWLSFILMICISHYLLTHKDAPWVKNVFAALRPAIIGLIAAAALLLMNKENFGTPSASLLLFVLSIALCIAVFFATLRYKVNPILALLVCGIIGLLVY